MKDDRFSKPTSKHRFGESNLEEMEEADIDDPGTPMQQEVINENDYSVLIDSNKSFEEQNRIGRQLFVSLISTGSVSSQKMTEAELETHKNIDEDLAMLTSSLLERQVRHSRKFLSFLTKPLTFTHCSADGNYEVRYKSNVLIYPDGEVLWIPPAIYQVIN